MVRPDVQTVIVDSDLSDLIDHVGANPADHDKVSELVHALRTRLA